MKEKRSEIILFCLFLAIASFFVQGVSAITVYSGETVELSGGASGTDYVYLFLTGPNLASEGVSLEDISSGVQTGDASTFVRVSVNNNNIWSYKWDTNTAGGTPDAGNYLVYAVNSPSGRKDLAGQEYATIQVTIIDPSVSAQISNKAAGTESVAIPTAIITENPEAESLSEPIKTESPVASSKPVQTTQAAGFFGIVLIAVFISSVLLIRTEKR